jgi:hypothetical protein
MWIFSRYGFFSADCARQGQGEYGQPVDPDRIMVRARLRAHLENLQQRFPDLLGALEIQQFEGTDYAYRIFIGKTVWAQVMAALADDIDYDNFKSAVARHLGSEGAAYEHALHDVWGTMYGLQQ